MGLFEDKVIIVTGGTKGIGLATVELLEENGAKAVACARNSNESLLLNDFYELDVTSVESCKNLFNKVIEKYGRIDGLVNNAGITKDSLTKKMSSADIFSVIETNLVGAFNLIQFIGPYMMERGCGSIVNISSIVGEYGNIGQANYAASKAGLIGATKSWAKEFAMKGQNVRVNAVCPGYIMTDMLSSVPEKLIDKFSSQTMLKRLGQPEEVAEVIQFLLCDKSSYITGAVIDVNGGMRL